MVSTIDSGQGMVLSVPELPMGIRFSATVQPVAKASTRARGKVGRALPEGISVSLRTRCRRYIFL